MKSIITNDYTKCYICGRRGGIEEHHIMFGAPNRKHSEEDGLKVPLCHWCHNEPPNGVHHNKGIDTQLKQMAQKKWMEYYGKDQEDFIRRYGKNYL